MKLGAIAVLLVVASACDASAANRVRVSVAGRLTAPVAGRSWTVRLSVRPVSFRGTIRVTASGPRRLDVRAAGAHGSYRARFVFPTPGRWSLVARAGTSTSRLGTVRVRPAPVQPVTFTEPTSIDLEPSGTLLLVENNPGRLLRVDPQTGPLTVLVPSVPRPYAIVRAPSGDVFFSIRNQLRRIDATGTVTEVEDANIEIGPVTTASNGDVYYSTATRIFRLAGGVGKPVPVAGTGAEGGGGDGGPALSAQLSSPHALGIAADGALLVSDAGNDRVRRIDPGSGVITAFAQVGTPHGMDIAPDGTVYVIDARASRLVHLSASGERIGLVARSSACPTTSRSEPAASPTFSKRARPATCAASRPTGR